MCVDVCGIEKTFKIGFSFISQKTGFSDYGSVLKNVDKLDRNILLSHSD